MTRWVGVCFCNRKAVFNLKHVDGKADLQGPAVQLGAEEKYFPSCFECYQVALNDVGQEWFNKSEKIIEENDELPLQDDENISPNPF